MSNTCDAGGEGLRHRAGPVARHRAAMRARDEICKPEALLAFLRVLQKRPFWKVTAAPGAIVTLPLVYRGSTRLTHHMVLFWSAMHEQAQSRVAQVRGALPCGRPL